MQESPTVDIEQELLRQIGHGMRAGLVGMIDASNAILTFHRPETFGKTQDEVRYLKANAHRTLANLDTLLDLLRLGHSTFKLQHVAIQDILHGAVTEFQSSSLEPTPAIRVDCSVDLPLVTGSHEPLRTAVVKMLQLVLKVNHPETIHLTATSNGNMVQIWVSTSKFTNEIISIPLPNFAARYEDSQIAADVLFCYRAAREHNGVFNATQNQEEIRLDILFSAMDD